MIDSLFNGGVRSLIERIQDGVFILEGRTIVYANRYLSEISGYSLEELIGMDVEKLIHPEDRDLVLGRYRRRIAGEPEPENYTFRIMTGQGASRILSLHIGFFGETEHLIGTVKDMTGLQETMEEMGRLKKELEQVVRKLPDIYYRTDLQGRLVRLSPSVKDILGYDIPEVLGTPITDYYVDSKEREKIVEAIFKAGGEVVRVEAPLLHKNGTPVWFSTNAYLVLDEEGKPVGIEGLARDDTSRKNLEKDLIRLSTVDSLTGLYNRRYVFERAEQEFQRSARYGSSMAILIMDLDHFKLINDNCGHHEGDEALKLFASICKSLIRSTDVVGRIGGEEFMLILPESDRDHAIYVAERIRSRCEKSEFGCREESLSVHVSIGIASRVEDTGSLEEMRIQADRALYEAKNRGRNRVFAL